jgi:hypothetical protein
MKRKIFDAVLVVLVLGLLGYTIWYAHQTKQIMADCKAGMEKASTPDQDAPAKVATAAKPAVDKPADVPATPAPPTPVVTPAPVAAETTKVCVEVIYADREVQVPVYVDRPVEKEVFVDREVQVPVYVDRPVDKIIYVDREVQLPPVERVVTKVVYKDRPVDRIVYVDREVQVPVYIERPVVLVQPRTVYVPRCPQPPPGGDIEGRRFFRPSR